MLDTVRFEETYSLAGMRGRPGTGVLILGATGQVGAELVRALARFFPLHLPNHQELDLNDPDSIRLGVRAARPRWIVNAAAYTAVDRAESEPERAFAINANALGILGETALEVGAAVVHFSTDYVFSGAGTDGFTEMDETGPVNVYGASKLAGERALLLSGAKHLIFRTSWVFGATGHNFLKTILQLARARDEVRIVNDQFGAPTWSRDVARMTAHVMARCDAGFRSPSSGKSVSEGVAWSSGIFHATSRGETTWHGFAVAALDLYKQQHPDARLAQIIPVPTSAYPTAASRPHNSRLDCRHLAQTFDWQMMDWDEALRHVMREL